jgi:hypothetical protein
MLDAFFDALFGATSLFLAVFLGLGMALFIVRAARESRSFPWGQYLMWLFATAGSAAVSVWVYMSRPSSPPLVDAILMKGDYAGWHFILTAYGAFCGVLIGGAVAGIRKCIDKNHHKGLVN